MSVDSQGNVSDSLPFTSSNNGLLERSMRLKNGGRSPTWTLPEKSFFYSSSTSIVRDIFQKQRPIERITLPAENLYIARDPCHVKFSRDPIHREGQHFECFWKRIELNTTCVGSRVEHEVLVDSLDIANIQRFIGEADAFQ